MGNIIDANALEQYKKDMQTYALGVIYGRMCPDYRDGLKLVHRRIIYGMYNFSHATTKAQKTKSANVVGDVLGKLHPHGDAAIYDAMKPLANNFEIMVPMIEPSGEWGTMSGDPAAASRYTECNLSAFANECMLADLRSSSKSVDWFETYNSSNLEPAFLPAAVPMLLVNGCFGIAIGLKVDVPKHNLAEVIDATLELMKNPNAEIVLVPDHCTPCEIVNTDWRAISETGMGSYVARGIIDIGTFEGKDALFIRSTPDLTFLNNIVAKLESLIKDNKIIQIADTFDNCTYTSKDDQKIEYIIVLKKGADPNFVRQTIYANTEMQKTCRVNIEVLDGLNLKRMGYKEVLQNWINFRINTKFRVYCGIVQVTQTEIHKKEAFIKAMESGEIDNIIKMIRSRKEQDDNELMEYLIKKLKITDLQAKYIINASVKELSLGYLNKYKEDQLKLKEKFDYYNTRILNDKLITTDIIEELNMIKAKYGKPRNCKIISEGDASGVPAGEFRLIITQNNFVKKIGLGDTFGSFKNDAPKIVMKVDNAENILVFSSNGKVYKQAISKIPLSDKSSIGTDIRFINKFIAGDICAVIYEPIVQMFAKKKDKYYVAVVTKTGLIKKMDLDDFQTIANSGIIFTKLDVGDTIKSIAIAGDGLDLIVYSKSKALRLSMLDVPYQKRSTKGMKSMSSSPEVDGMSIIKPDTTDIIVVTEQGRVNKFDVVGMPRSSRNKAGSKVISLAKGDAIKAIFGGNDSDILKLVTKEGNIEIPVSTIPRASTVSQGIKGCNKTSLLLRCEIYKQTT